MSPCVFKRLLATFLKNDVSTTRLPCVLAFGLHLSQNVLMQTLFKKTYLQPLPKNAIVQTKNGNFAVHIRDDHPVHQFEEAGMLFAEHFDAQVETGRQIQHFHDSSS